MLRGAALGHRVGAFVSRAHTQTRTQTRTLFAARAFASDADEAKRAFDVEFQEKLEVKPILIQPSQFGKEVLNDSLLNKGTAFSLRERSNCGLTGLLPPRKFTLEQQLERAYKGFQRDTDMSKWTSTSTDILKFVYLMQLHDRNETLFFKMILENIEELAPIIYTPTVGAACQQAALIFRKPRGIYFTFEDRGNMHQIVNNWPRKEVDVVVVTDGSRILGLGDMGVHGMAIPIGKLALYTAAGGIDPARCLPVQIDVGTNNESLLNNDFYLGRRHHRVTGQDFLQTMDEFMLAIHSRYPNAIIQFEDFSTDNASTLLNRYRDHFSTFNDDIQGTGAVALAGVLSAMRKIGADATHLSEQRIVCVGAGSAGVGVCTTIMNAMKQQGASDEEAQGRFWMVDDRGLMTSERPPEDVTEHQVPFLRDEPGTEGMRLQQIIDEVKPTVLLGLSGVGGVFEEGVVRAMGEHVEAPIVFALSNPTNRSECTAAQAYEWTNGRAVYASGSPFDNVVLDGKTYTPTQLNNMYIFPAVGLGATVCGAKSIKDEMFYELALELASITDTADPMLFPPIKEIRNVTAQLATRFCEVAEEMNLATKPKKEGCTWGKTVDIAMYKPVYSPLVYAGNEK